MGRARRWVPVVLGVVVAGAATARLGVPAAWLIAPLLVGLAVALGRGAAPALPGPVLITAQEVIGAALGAAVQPEVLGQVGRALPAVAGVALGTLVLSVLAGLLLARLTPLDRPTAVLGMLAGAAEGVLVASQEARADARLVAVVQYLRMILVVASVPFFAGCSSRWAGPPRRRWRRGAALNAVLATAYDTGATATFVIAAQVLRFLVFVVVGPTLASRWTPRGRAGVSYGALVSRCHAAASPGWDKLSIT